jgi:cytochrome b involved in lipid metabolism
MFNYLKSLIIRKNIPTITFEEFKSHCTEKSLWVCMGKNVYDITEYIYDHPGGQKCLLANAAMDITFHAGFHSSRMRELLKPFFIGELDSDSLLQVNDSHSCCKLC